MIFLWLASSIHILVCYMYTNDKIISVFAYGLFFFVHLILVNIFYISLKSKYSYKIDLIFYLLMNFIVFNLFLTIDDFSLIALPLSLAVVFPCLKLIYFTLQKKLPLFTFLQKILFFIIILNTIYYLTYPFIRYDQEFFQFSELAAFLIMFVISILVPVIVLSNIAEGQEKMLIQQSKLAAMGEMIGNIAHQWRQPLNNLALRIQILEDDFNSNNLSKENLQELSVGSLNTINKMSKTIDDFRNFFSPSKEMKKFNVGEAITEALEIIEASLKYYDIHIVKRFYKDFEVYGYNTEFSQVILNLINNSKDALLKRKDIKHKKIIIELKKSTEYNVLIRVEDNGGGIDLDIIDKIFEPYFTTKYKAEGTGIGLYMSKMIIERNMNGKITARNSHDGVIFDVEI